MEFASYRCKVVLDTVKFENNQFVIKVNDIKWIGFDYRYDNIMNKNQSKQSNPFMNEGKIDEMININVKLNGKKVEVKGKEPEDSEIQIIINVYNITFVMLLKCIKEVILFFEQNTSCLKVNPLEVNIHNYYK